jgi:hypothetical protein
MIVAAVAALGLCLATAAPAEAQYYWRQYSTPNTVFINPGVSYYSPYTTYYSTPSLSVPGWSYYPGYNPGYYGFRTPQYYRWDWYNPYTNQYRFWRWVR